MVFGKKINYIRCQTNDFKIKKKKTTSLLYKKEHAEYGPTLKASVFSFERTYFMKLVAYLLETFVFVLIFLYFPKRNNLSLFVYIVTSPFQIS